MWKLSPDLCRRGVWVTYQLMRRKSTLRNRALLPAPGDSSVFEAGVSLTLVRSATDPEGVHRPKLGPVGPTGAPAEVLDGGEGAWWLGSLHSLAPTAEGDLRIVPVSALLVYEEAQWWGEGLARAQLGTVPAEARWGEGGQEWGASSGCVQS